MLKCIDSKLLVPLIFRTSSRMAVPGVVQPGGGLPHGNNDDGSFEEMPNDNELHQQRE